ncbi:hypothetical protein ACOMHN_011805 [Nucella lapillus]
MALPGKLGVALVVALASNVSLFSMFLFPRKSSTSTTSAPTTAITTIIRPTTNSSNSNGDVIRENETRLPDYISNLPRSAELRDGETPHEGFTNEKQKEDRPTTSPGYKNSFDDSGFTNNELPPADMRRRLAPTTTRPTRSRDQRKDWYPKPRRGDIDPEMEYGESLQPERIRVESGREDVNPESMKPAGKGATSPSGMQGVHPQPIKPGGDVTVTPSKPTENNLKTEREENQEDPKEEDVSPKSKINYQHPTTTESHLPSGSENVASLSPGIEPRQESENEGRHAGSEQKSNPSQQKKDLHQARPGMRGADPRSRREDLRSPSAEGSSSVSAGRLSRRKDSDYHLQNVIASLTNNELEQLDSGTAEVLIPALRSLESLVLRQLENLHDVTARQERRLQRLEQSKLKRSEVKDAIEVIRQEQRKLGLLPKEHSPESSASPGIHHSNSSGEADNHLEKLHNSGDGSDGGEETIILETTTTVTMTASTMTTARRNTTERSDENIINHIYELYNSLTSMEHKVVEVSNKLTSVGSEVYRERSTFGRLEDNVGEIRRNQKNLLMRSTVQGFKLSDLEQFKGQAEILLGTAEGTIDQFDSKLEVFTDRMMVQEDEVDIMRDVFSRLEQMSHELRSSDSFKAHHMQELKRAYQQVETRLSNIVHSLDQSMGNVRWDIKTSLDNLCTSNDLQC